MIDVILDTDTYNEVDDQYALSYLLRNNDQLNTVAIYAAPFLNKRVSSTEEGMEKSYNEILHILNLANREDLVPVVFKGSKNYLKDENTPQISDAANDLAKRAMNYTKENPLVVVGIGCITDVASAMLINPEICERIKLVWLGGHARHFHDTREFNMGQDWAAARIVMRDAGQFIQLPCHGVVSAFTVSKQELEKFLVGKNPLADYLAKFTIEAADSYAYGRDWTRVIWDVTAVAYLLDVNHNYMFYREEDIRLPSYDGYYEEKPLNKKMVYVYEIRRDNLMNDLFKSLLK